jgi:hypothetical protein
MKRYKQNLFGGLAVSVDKIDIKEQYSVDCENVDVFRLGELRNMMGMEKQNSAQLGSASNIIAVHQFDDEEFVNVSGTIIKM